MRCRYLTFKILTDKRPSGDQPQAIKEIVERLKKGEKDITLLGATGTGKTFTIANVIEKVKKPTLIISHNKTLAAQLYQELKELFPNNAVHYFISYYDYYQPEAYVPKTDTYIAKEADVNEEIDQLRLAATSSLLDREDVIIVASVSCIYGLGSPEDYKNMIVPLSVGQKFDRQKFFRELVDIQYERNQNFFERGKFRVNGDTIDVFLSYSKIALRIELWDNEIESLSYFNPITGETMEKIKNVIIYPAKHFVMKGSGLQAAIRNIKKELDKREMELVQNKDFIAAQRIRQRTEYDIEMMEEIGYCNGIENYSRHLLGRPPGSRPYTLIDYFPKDFLLIIDESHVTLPQIRGMFAGDFSRKSTLVNFGFRLASAMDNRPLKFEEFEALKGQTIYLSATPAKYELEKSNGVVEQIIRPTGLVDPEIIIRPTKDQMTDLKKEIDIQVKKGKRVLVTTLTKRMAEDITDYMNSENIKTKYLHSDIDALERTEIIRELRLGKFDVLVGINLLREGLDIPEVGLVSILDADKEGFLRSTTSLIQTIGRAARNAEGRVVMYADRMTDSMKNAISETNRRREKQIAYNKKHQITPQTIQKTIHDKVRLIKEIEEDELDMNQHDLLVKLEAEMRKAAEKLDFETAARLRDKIKKIAKEIEIDE